MHLAGLFSIPLIQFMLSPTGRSMVWFAWERLKEAFGKTAAAASPKGITVVVEKESAQGDKTRVVISTHDGPTVAQLVQGPSATSLKRFPPALGGECPGAPHTPANPEPAAPLLPTQVMSPGLVSPVFW